MLCFSGYLLTVECRVMRPLISWLKASVLQTSLTGLPHNSIEIKVKKAFKDFFHRERKLKALCQTGLTFLPLQVILWEICCFIF